MRTLVAVADRGRFKAFNLVKEEGDSRAHLELVETGRQDEVRTKLSEQLTDSAGRFPRGSGPADFGDTGMSIGERHNLESEQQRRALHAIAAELSELLAGGEYDACWLAAAAPIQQPLLDALRPEARAKIQRTLSLDLTKTDPSEVLQHFESA